MLRLKSSTYNPCLATNTARLALTVWLFTSTPANTASLYDTVILGLKQNLALQASQLGVEENQYNIAISRSTFLPAINASADTTWNQNTTIYNISDNARSSYNSHSYSLSLSLTLFDMQNIYDYQSAKLNYDTEKLTHDNQVQQTIFRIASNYFAYLKNSAQIRATEAELKSANIREKQITRNIELGNTAVNEIYEALSQKEAVKNRLFNLNKDNLIILNELNTLVQTPVSPSEDLVEQLNFALFSNQEQQHILAQLPYNYEVMIAKNQVKASELASRSSKSRFYPNLSLSASYRNDDANNYDITDPEATGQTTGAVVGLNLSLPIFAGGADYYGVKKAKLALQRSDMLYQNTLASTKEQLTASILNINSLATSITQLENIMLANHASYLGIQKAYQLGTRTITDLLAAESKLFNAVRDYQSARYDYLTERINIEQLQGTLTLVSIQNLTRLMQVYPTELQANQDEIGNIVPAYLLSRKIAPHFPLREFH